MRLSAVVINIVLLKSTCGIALVGFAFIVIWIFGGASMVRRTDASCVVGPSTARRAVKRRTFDSVSRRGLESLGPTRSWRRRRFVLETLLAPLTLHLPVCGKKGEKIRASLRFGRTSCHAAAAAATAHQEIHGASPAPPRLARVRSSVPRPGESVVRVRGRGVGCTIASTVELQLQEQNERCARPRTRPTVVYFFPAL